MKELLKTIIADQRDMKWTDSLVPRSFPSSLIDTDEVVVISGVRRCGKSVLLQQIRAKQSDQDYFLNFDDDRLIHFKVEHFQLLYELFLELFGEQRTFYFDEIQNVFGWERFVRRLYDNGMKVFITGSNAKMLSRELGTHLTGRNISYELYPFSFNEYLNYFSIGDSNKLITTKERAVLVRHFAQYINDGGFPVFLKNKNPDYLKSVYQGILYRDVMVKNQLTNESEIMEMVYYLASNIAKPTSNSSLARIIGVKNATTVKNYLNYMEDSYLLFQIPKFDYSLKKQIQNPKKTYIIDNGIAQRLGFSFTDNIGRLLENLVFIELKRRGKMVYYHHKNGECDFLIKENKKITQAFQVCYYLDNALTKQREVLGLIEAMNEYNLKQGRIITFDQKEEIKSDDKQIKVIPAWEWLAT